MKNKKNLVIISIFIIIFICIAVILYLSDQKNQKEKEDELNQSIEFRNCLIQDGLNPNTVDLYTDKRASKCIDKFNIQIYMPLNKK